MHLIIYQMHKFDINPKRVGKDNIGCSFCKYSDICFMKEEDVVLLDEHNNLDFYKEKRMKKKLALV